MPRLTILGTGTSTGVPQMGCTCPVCTSSDPLDMRLRTSALLETASKRRILFDCGPDFRQQMLSLPFHRLDAVLLTHEHYDHVGGLDDLRPFSVFGEVNVYADPICRAHLLDRIPYCFGQSLYPGVPKINLCEVDFDQPFEAAGEKIVPIRLFHGKLPIAGYRIGDMGYLTDMSRIEPEEKAKIDSVKLLVVNALRDEPHPSHQSLSEALTFIESLQPQPERVYLVHFAHQIGLHRDLIRRLPPHVFPAFDGLTIEF